MRYQRDHDGGRFFEGQSVGTLRVVNRQVAGSEQGFPTVLDQQTIPIELVRDFVEIPISAGSQVLRALHRVGFRLDAHQSDITEHGGAKSCSEVSARNLLA